MQVPKKIRKMIEDRAKYQWKAHKLQFEIDDWCRKHGVEQTYFGTDFMLYTEPDVVVIATIEDIENT